ncbi:hypothetical protein ACOSQ4_020753 [Xanthoceras sorbifolium]
MNTSPASPPALPPPTTTTAPSPAVVEDESRQLSVYTGPNLNNPPNVSFSQYHCLTAAPVSQFTMISPTDTTQRFSNFKDLNISSGHRFLPTDRVLIVDYLMKKVKNQRLSHNIIIEDNIYKYNPWDLAAKYEPQEEHQWYFFTSRDRKYAKGNRPNRAAGDGFWKATGVEKKIYNNKKELIGAKSPLVFFKGKPPKGNKTNWLMHEYLVDNSPPSSSSNNMRLNDCVLCKIYKKVGKSKQDHFGNDDNLDISQRLNIIPANRVVEFQNQPVNNVAATCGITYSDMVDPPLGFEDDDATYPLLGFEDDNDMWNMPDLCVDRGYQSTGDLGDILIESANLLKKEKKPSVWDDNIFR